jgi:lactoylglutathione lyase
MLRTWAIVGAQGLEVRLASMNGAFLHTCYRVADLDRSIAFYTECLGMELRRTMPIRDEAINAFLSYAGDEESRLELTFNHGRTEPYEIGTGYGHIALGVENMEQTLAALAEKGIEPEKPPYRVREGGSLLCFVRDPDGYRIELIERRL